MDPQTLIAMHIGQELKTGMLVNLGVGIPTLVSNYVPSGIRIYFQSENGLIGTGPIPEEGMNLALLTDAAGQPVSALPGSCTFDTAMSFGPIRGGHLDVSVLGGQQVDGRGLLANWTIPGKMVPGMGGSTSWCTRWPGRRRKTCGAACWTVRRRASGRRWTSPATPSSASRAPARR
jgi:acetate CoA/acetoacetate CoA-transferase beta subunit